MTQLEGGLAVHWQPLAMHRSCFTSDFCTYSRRPLRQQLTTSRPQLPALAEQGAGHDAGLICTAEQLLNSVGDSSMLGPPLNCGNVTVV